jgi:hypothetical protein
MGVSQGRQMDSREAHNLFLLGSIPSPVILPMPSTGSLKRFYATGNRPDDCSFSVEDERGVQICSFPDGPNSRAYAELIADLLNKEYDLGPAYKLWPKDGTAQA